jgi:hypothetical protein
MKKTLLLLLLAISLLSACGGESQLTEEQPIPTSEPSPLPTPEATLPPPVLDVQENDGRDPETETEPDSENVAEEEVSQPEPTPTKEFVALETWPADRFGYGIQSHATIGDPAATMDVIAHQLGMNWVKVQFQWPLVQPTPDQIDWFHYDGIVDEASRNGLHLMFSVVGAPAWSRSAGNDHGPPDDYNLYANLVGEIVARYQGKVHAIEVWNEQNLDREWATAGGIDAGAYVDFLALAHDAIKAADPEVIVISGALAPTTDGDWVRWADDYEYLDQMLEAGLLDYTDCVGAHHNGYNTPPDLPYDQVGSFEEAGTATFRGPYNDPRPFWSFYSTLERYAQRVQEADPDMKLCVTEFGWASSEGYDEVPPGFEFALDNTLQEQADYIVQAFNQMHDSGDVWLAFLFNFDFGNKGGGPTDDPVPYSIVDTNGVPRPAFGAVAGMEKRP